MIRLTTPKHKFKFTVDPDASYKVIRISYAQNGIVLFNKEKEDMTFETDTSGDEPVYWAWFRLSQAETKQFRARPGDVADIQVRALSYADEALASKTWHVKIEDVLDDEVLT